MKPAKKIIKLSLLGVLALLLLNFPILSIASETGLSEGIPTLYLYVFVAWLILLILVALTLENTFFNKKGDDRE